MLIIKNGTIHTMTGKTYRKGDVLIDGQRIKSVGENIPAGLWSGHDVNIIDAGGLHVYPGFIDAHSHIGITEEKKGKAGDDCNEVTNPITPCLRAIDAINPMDSAFHNAIAAGITAAMVGPGSANPIGGQFALIKTDGRRIDNMIVKAPAAMKIAFGENPKTNYGSIGTIPSTRMAIASLIREELFNARQYYRDKMACQRDGSDFEESFSMECYVPLFEKRIPLKAHVHRVDDIFTAIRIAKEFDLLLTLDHCTEGHLIADDIFESGYPAIVGPSLASRTKIEVKSSDFMTAGVLNKSGVLVALTTDHPVSRIQYLPICAGLAAKEGMGKEEALMAITINAARICGAADRIGTIEAGKDADIVVYDGSPLEIFSKAVYTLINGQVVYKSNA